MALEPDPRSEAMARHFDDYFLKFIFARLRWRQRIYRSANNFAGEDAEHIGHPCMYIQ